MDFLIKGQRGTRSHADNHKATGLTVNLHTDLTFLKAGLTSNFLKNNVLLSVTKFTLERNPIMAALITSDSKTTVCF